MAFGLNETKQLIDLTVNAMVQHLGTPEEQAREFLFKVIRDEEIEKHEFLLNFCTLPEEKRIEAWQHIFQRLAAVAPKKNIKKKLLNACKCALDSCCYED